MFARRLNELQLTLLIKPDDALLLIKEGRHLEGKNKERRSFHRGEHIDRSPARPRRREGGGTGDYDSPDNCFDMAFVYSSTHEGDRLYLPGSSLRGVLRSAAERIVGRWRPDLADDPFSALAADDASSDTLDSTPQGDAIYRQAGPLARCFGHPTLRGRWRIADAWIENEATANVQMAVRDGVGIDRATGAAKTSIKFQFEAVSSAVFKTTLVLVNYELWQLGLLAHVLAALDTGDVRIGYGTRRGLGRVRLSIADMTWRWYGYCPAEQDGQVALPSLHALTEWVRGRVAHDPLPATEAYGLRDAKQECTLPLTLHSAGLWTEGRLISEAPASQSAWNPVNWLAAPWPILGPLLPQVLTTWNTVPEGAR
jgi:CRISPR/Cas system CSM-associated protein Csm3 (group 7 of RAMP superfamily)